MACIARKITSSYTFKPQIFVGDKKWAQEEGKVKKKKEDVKADREAAWHTHTLNFFPLNYKGRVKTKEVKLNWTVLDCWKTRLADVDNIQM